MQKCNHVIIIKKILHSLFTNEKKKIRLEWTQSSISSYEKSIIRKPIFLLYYLTHLLFMLMGWLIEEFWKTINSSFSWWSFEKQLKKHGGRSVSFSFSFSFFYLQFDSWDYVEWPYFLDLCLNLQFK